MANNQLTKEEIKRKNRRQRRVVVGVIVSVLVIIGIVSIMQIGIKLANTVFDDTKEKQEFKSRIETLVMLEILPFESLSAADEETIMQASIWSVLFGDDVTKLAKDESDSYLVPAVDVDRYVAKLFGPDYSISHRAFVASDGLEFQYNEDTQVYTMPITGMVSAYTAEIEKIKTGRGVKRVTVGYIPPSSDAFMGLGSQTQTATPTKYYDYIFTKRDKEYYLASIEESEMQPVVPTATNSGNVDTAVLPDDPNKVVEEVVGNIEIDSSMATDSTPQEEPPAE